MAVTTVWEAGGHSVRVDGSPMAHNVRAACSCGWVSDQVDYHWALKQADSHLGFFEAAELTVELGGVDDVDVGDRIAVDLGPADHVPGPHRPSRRGRPSGPGHLPGS